MLKIKWRLKMCIRDRDVDYDARAYRCNSNGIIKLNSSISNQDITTTFQELISPETDLVIPEEHDCINPMNSSTVYPCLLYTSRCV